MAGLVLINRLLRMFRFNRPLSIFVCRGEKLNLDRILFCITTLEGIGPAAVVVDDFVNLFHDAARLVQSHDDLLVVVVSPIVKKRSPFPFFAHGLSAISRRLGSRRTKSSKRPQAPA